MTMNSTTNQGAPYPNVNEPLNNVNDWIYALATFMETRATQRFATQAELASKRPTPSAGEFAWVTDGQVLQVYNGTTWKRVFPPQPMVYSGTATPSSALGQPGDLYIKTT